MASEIDRDAPFTPGELICAAILFVAGLVGLSSCCGCAYKGGKAVDGTNLAIGITVPGTDWQVNLLDYVGGLRVAGNDQTRISVSNEVIEMNSYFGVVETRRASKMAAQIEPCETVPSTEE